MYFFFRDRLCVSNTNVGLGENIKAWRKKRNWTTYVLAEKSGIPQGNISRFEQNAVRPRPATMNKLAAALGSTPLQLEYGSEDIEFIPVGTRKVPILDYVQAGRWTGVNDAPAEADAAEFIYTDATISEKAFAMIFRGESMLPEFRPGDMGLFDPEMQPRPGDYVIAVDTQGEAVFKRYKVLGINPEGQEVFELRPLNDFYPTIRSDETPVRVVATLKDAIRRYRRD